jgi:hypothetical protein
VATVRALPGDGAWQGLSRTEPSRRRAARAHHLSEREALPALPAASDRVLRTNPRACAATCGVVELELAGRDVERARALWDWGKAATIWRCVAIAAR